VVRRGLSYRTIAVVGADITIDGLLIGLLLGANTRTGLLIGIALGVELLWSGSRLAHPAPRDLAPRL
jgi:hypothetical protein